MLVAWCNINLEMIINIARIKIRFLLFAICFSPGLATAQVVSDGQDVPALAGFDNAMLEFMQAHNVPDAQLAVTWQGRLVLARSYDHQSGNPVNNRSRFRVASVSKPLTSTLMHRLQQDGGVSVDDTLDQYLDLTPPDGQNADPQLGGITVRNLLEHLAGFGTATNFGYDPVFHDVDIANELSVDLPILKSHVRSFMNGKSLVSTPDTEYNYSNYGYMLAGQVIEAATGMPYGAYADSVLNRIGIYDARQSRSQRHRAYADEVEYFSGNRGASVMQDNGGRLPYEYGALNYENAAAFGGWTLNMVEAARWLANLDDPEATDAILDAESQALMFGLPENQQGPYTSGDAYYGSGWLVRDYGGGGRNTWHGGSLPGTTAYIVRIRQGFNFAVAINRRNESNPGAWLGDLESRIIAAYNQVDQWPSHDLFDQELRPAPQAAGARYGGSWYDPDHKGEGFAITVISPDTAVIYWFTYKPDGRQAWYFGVASLDGHRMVIENLLEASGGRFGPDFDPDEVDISTVGSLVINFYEDNKAKADYLLEGDSGYMELTRITRPFANDDPQAAGDWRTGLWFDPSHNGEGYVVEVLEDGRVVIYWFTYDQSGNPAWMLTTSIDGELGSGMTLPMDRHAGGNFGVAFDPSRVQVLENGSADMTISCEESDVSYSGGDSGFPDVELTLERIAGYMPLPCENP
jgi:CubicO group peptidase (beta-lactamase class C family)